MKLYYTPGACSLASHISLREAGIDFEGVQVDLRSKKTADGKDFTTINSKGYVPALQLDDGELLTENIAILQYIGDQKPDRKLAPPAGSRERYRLVEWLAFISTELHKGFSPFFNPATPDAYKGIARDRLVLRLDWLEKQLGSKQYLMGDQFTVADAYLFTILSWSGAAGLDLARWSGLKQYFDRVAARPAVEQARQAEGLVNK
ncbi:MAG: glutathione transferase GstA [Pseudomonadota bacterium]|jgi:Glutathione S-transferase|nr:MAG: glutathione transferase GstA [Pseudomonadota bacterium]